LKKALQGKLLQECFGTLLNPKKSLVNDFEHKFNLSCEIAALPGKGASKSWENSPTAQ
jgi:hypothetical protein